VCHYAVCHFLCVIMLCVVMLSVVMLSVVILCVIMLSAVAHIHTYTHTHWVYILMDICEKYIFQNSKLQARMFQKIVLTHPPTNFID
jgi:hypothetical protein